MTITLSHSYYNNDVTFGALSFEGDDTKFVTLENLSLTNYPKITQKTSYPESEYEVFFLCPNVTMLQCYTFFLGYKTRKKT